MPKEKSENSSLRPFFEIEAILLDVASNSQVALIALTSLCQNLPRSTLNANAWKLETSIVGLHRQFEMLEQKCQSLLTVVTDKTG